MKNSPTRLSPELRSPLPRFGVLLVALTIALGILSGGCASDAAKAPATQSELTSFRGDPSKMPKDLPNVPANPSGGKPANAKP